MMSRSLDMNWAALAVSLLSDRQIGPETAFVRLFNPTQHEKKYRQKLDGQAYQRNFTEDQFKAMAKWRGEDVPVSWAEIARRMNCSPTCVRNNLIKYLKGAA